MKKSKVAAVLTVLGILSVSALSALYLAGKDQAEMSRCGCSEK